MLELRYYEKPLENLKEYFCHATIRSEKDLKHVDSSIDVVHIDMDVSRELLEAVYKRAPFLRIIRIRPEALSDLSVETKNFFELHDLALYLGHHREKAEPKVLAEAAERRKRSKVTKQNFDSFQTLLKLYEGLSKKERKRFKRCLDLGILEAELTRAYFEDPFTQEEIALQNGVNQRFVSLSMYGMMLYLKGDIPGTPKRYAGEAKRIARKVRRVGEERRKARRRNNFSARHHVHAVSKYFYESPGVFAQYGNVLRVWAHDRENGVFDKPFRALSEREGGMIKKYFGIPDGRSHTAAAIAEEYAVTPTRVREIIFRQAYRKLQFYADRHGIVWTYHP